jgi:uncharacterized membrane protein
VAYAAVKEGRFVNRGFLNGPICPIYGIGVGVVVQFLMPFREQYIILYIASTVLVTILEGITGFLLDKIFHHRWWDYSKMPLNIGGYVCLLFSLIWGVACVFVVKVVHPLVHKALALIPFYLGIVIIIILGIVMFADLYVTASTILKLNKRLDAMEKIAEELRELSDKMGEDIYENVMDGMEFREEGRQRLEEGKQHLEEMSEERKQRLEEMSEERKQRLEEMSEERRQRLEEMSEERRQRLEEGKQHLEEMSEERKQRLEEMSEERRQRLEARREELQTRYRELAEHRNSVSTRLMKAFPHMHSHRHGKILEELKEALQKRS